MGLIINFISYIIYLYKCWNLKEKILIYFVSKSKKCEHNLLKHEFNPSSIKFKVGIQIQLHCPVKRKLIALIIQGYFYEFSWAEIGILRRVLWDPSYQLQFPRLRQ